MVPVIQTGVSANMAWEWCAAVTPDAVISAITRMRSTATRCARLRPGADIPASDTLATAPRPVTRLGLTRIIPLATAHKRDAMSPTLPTRRNLLYTGVGAAAGLALLPACTTDSAAPAATSAIMTRERYLQYVGWFNANDPRFLEFYHPDVVLELGNATLNGAAAIRDLYYDVTYSIQVTVERNHLFADAV